MYLGVEIGGTKLQLAVGRGDGSPFIALERQQIDAQNGAAGILAQIEQASAALLRRHSIGAVGVGFGGPVDAAAGRVITSHQITGWDNFEIAAWCQQVFGCPVALTNDCDAAALAEARYGAGKEFRSVFYVTVGTGIGGGWVLEGKMHGAGSPAAAEIGHLRPGVHAMHENATVESLASGLGIAATAAARLAGHITRPMDDVRREAALADPARVRQELADAGQAQHEYLHDLNQRCAGDVDLLTGKMIAQAAIEGNDVAKEILVRAQQVLGWAIAQAITLIAPEVVVIGGGVSLIGEHFFFAPVREEVDRYVFPPLRKSYRIVPAALGESVVVHGALALAADLDAEAN